MPQKYDNTSISSLKGADRVRKRPGVIFGSDGIEGCCHSFFEILSNSIDEAREGFGGVIETTRFADGSIQVRDYGRGIPLDYNEKEQRYNWELVFCELYAGGKYNNISGDNYEYSLGLNGLGSCATQYSSEYMDVEVVRDGSIFNLHFEKGENIGGLQTTKTTKKTPTGTTIKWKPDLAVFTDIDIPIEYYVSVLKKQAVVNNGLKFTFYDETSEQSQEFLYENGIEDYIKEIASEKAITSPQYFVGERLGRDRADKPEYKVKLNLVFCFNEEVNLIEYYHNSSFLEHGGAPDKAVKNAFVFAIDKYLKDNNKYSKNESKISFPDIADCLCLVSSNFSTVTSYENQTKKSITNKFIQDAMTDFIKHNLEIYFIENKADADKIAEQVLINKHSRETAEKSKKNMKKMLSMGTSVTDRVQKFVDCRTKDKARREIYIVEGDSALGSCKLGRDAEFQAIIPVRGKILNCLKANYDKIFKSDIILDLVRVLGCGVEVKSKHNKDLNTFELENLRWSRVIICTDADVDGYQIRTLILTMFHRLMPTLIEEGMVYIAESPLFEISCGNKTYFAYNENEKGEILDKLDGKKFSIQRSKGLGENQPEMMWETTMNPETRRLIRVMPEDNLELTQAKFEMLLGDNLDGRKNHIALNGGKYIDMLDVS
ncbi:MAG: DNA topoisomerase [Clostridiales bacterium]|jgi:DNA gyrase subunit B|nr:DNA topoisomerase [Clostridiales bacterium]